MCDKVVCERFCVTKLRATKLSLCVCGRLCVEDCVCVTKLCEKDCVCERLCVCVCGQVVAYERLRECVCV